MRLTLVAHDIGGVGGMERVLAELVGGLLARGDDVNVISRTCELPRHPRLAWTRVPGPARPVPVAYPWFFLIGSLLTWRRRAGFLLTTGAIVGNQADWSAVHLCHHAVRELSLSRMSRRTNVYRLNALLAQFLSRAGERFCYRPGRTRELIGVSPGVAGELGRHFPQMAVKTILNGVSVDRFRPDAAQGSAIRERYGVKAGDLLALFVGSEWEGKGLRYAIEALALADGWKLLVVGRGDLAAFRALADRLGVLDRVLFVGVVDDTAPCYCAADAFLLPSVYETFSLVTYEAAACGVPLLATPVSGVADLLVDGTNGWFISRDKADIARKLRSLAANPAQRIKMGRNGRRSAAAFSWDQMVESYRNLAGSAVTAATNAMSNGDSDRRTSKVPFTLS